MAELHEYPFTQYEDCSLGCFMGLCKRVGVKLAVVGDSLQLLDRNNFVLSQVKIYQATVALQDEEGHDLTAYIINAGVRDEHVVFTKGNGDQIVIDVPKAEVAEKDSDGNDITSYLMNMTVSGDKLHVTRGDGSSFEVTVPFAVKAATTVDNIPLTTLAASMEVSGQNIILKDSRDNVISTIRCAWSDRAQSDENGNNIRENYGSTLQAGTTTIKLISKSGDVLSEITVPYSTTSTYSPSGAEFDAEFGAHLVIDADGKSVDLTAQNGQLLNKITVPFSTLATDATNAIELAEISGDQLVLTTYGGTVIRLTCPYSVRSLKDNSSNVITTYYAHSMTQDPVTGKITLWDAEGNALSELVPTANVAQYDTYNNLIADYIKTLVFDNQSDYLVATHGDGTTDSIVINYSNVAWKDTQGNIIKNTYVAFVSNVVDGEGEWVMVFYNGSGAELFRLKVVANKAQKDADGNVITDFYVHSLTISGDTISFNDANDVAIGSITLPKYVAGMEWEYPSESFWYRTYDIDGTTLQRIKFPIQSWLRLGLVQTDRIQLQDFDNEELNSGRSTVHLPEYYYDAAISGSDLLLKDIHGNTRTTLALPAGDKYHIVTDGILSDTKVINYTSQAVAAITPKVLNILNESGVLKGRIYTVDYSYDRFIGAEVINVPVQNSVSIAQNTSEFVRLNYTSLSSSSIYRDDFAAFNSKGVVVDNNNILTNPYTPDKEFVIRETNKPGAATTELYESGSSQWIPGSAYAKWGGRNLHMTCANVLNNSTPIAFTAGDLIQLEKRYWLDCGVKGVEFYNDDTHIIPAQIQYNGTIMAMIRANGMKSARITTYKQDGTVLQQKTINTISGNITMLQLRACTTGESSVAKLELCNSPSFVAMNGGINFYINVANTISQYTFNLS